MKSSTMGIPVYQSFGFKLAGGKGFSGDIAYYPMSLVLDNEVNQESNVKRKLISGGSEFEEKIGYSRAVVDGDYVFVSGTTGYNYETMSISSDPVEQADQCFKNIEKALIQAGSSIDNIVRVHYIYPNKLDFEPCWPVFKKYLSTARPAATVFVAGLLDEAMKLEIEVTARLNA